MVKSKNSSGFTLIEMLLTIVVLGLAITAIAGLYYQMQNLQTDSRYMNLATSAAQTEIEVLRNNSYNSLTPGSTINFTNSLPSSLPHGSTGTVEVSQPISGLRRVDVTVSYQSGDITRNVELSSTIGVIGIGK